MTLSTQELETRLWSVADSLRANSELTSAEYKSPVLGLVFLRFVDHKFAAVQAQLEGQAGSSSRRTVGKADYIAQGAIFLPEEARYAHLLKLPEGADLGRAVSDAMEAIENENTALRGILPRDYSRVTNPTLATLLRPFWEIPMDIEGDVFGRIYEYFLGKFAMAAGQSGGESYTPTSLTKLIVEIIEPYSGRVLDPASGSAGMLVQSAEFVKRHERNLAELSIFGQENVTETVRLGKMNLAVNDLSGDICHGNTYYEDVHDSVGKFDFVMANPPFNVDKVDKIVRHIADRGVLVHGAFMLGFPTETEEEMRETVRWARNSAFHTAAFFRVIPFKGTTLFSQVEEAGHPLPTDWAAYEPYETDINLSEVSEEKIAHLRKWAYRSFYFRPSRLWRLLRLLPRKSRLIQTLAGLFLKRAYAR